MADILDDGDEIPAGWGDMWHAQLPERERHPFLFYDESDRPQMLERLEREPWAGWWKDWQQIATRSKLAVRWWLLGNEEDARLCKLDLLKRPIRRQRPQGYLEPSSHSFADYVVAYDVLAAWDELGPEEHRVIRNRIAAEADHYYTVLRDDPRGGANYGNQRTLAASALGMAALTLCEYGDSANKPAQWLRRALYEIRREENFWFFRPDGLFVEGTGYTDYANMQFVPFAIALERATGRYLFEDPRLRQWLVFAAYQMTANGEVIPWGTCESRCGLGFFSLLSNRRYGRDLAPLFHRAFNLSTNPSLRPNHVPIALARYELDTAGEPPPASRAFPQSQTVVLRADWGHESVAAWFAGKDGTWPLDYRYETYSHGDSGHFVLAAWDEVLAADSGYDHWQSRDYYDAEFHNVILIDGQGPQRDTPGKMSDVRIEGPLRHATMTTSYQGCTVRRTLALVRDRYVVLLDRISADAEHDYAWQLRSTCPPETPGTRLGKREVTWPGLSADHWRSLEPGRTQLTTVVPPFSELTLEKGRWRPISRVSEFANQVAVARWRDGSTTALFALIPNLQDRIEATWHADAGQNLVIRGPGWMDRVAVDGGKLRVTDGAGRWDCRLPR